MHAPPSFKTGSSQKYFFFVNSGVLDVRARLAHMRYSRHHGNRVRGLVCEAIIWVD